jgi:hypothetical protein
MAGSKDKVRNNTGGVSGMSEDEIDLFDYFRVLWKRKYFILSFAVLPALIVAFVFACLPKDCRITYTYDTWLDTEPSKRLYSEFVGIKPEKPEQSETQLDDVLSEKRRRILLDAFYGNENPSKLAANVRENGFAEFAQEISKTRIQLEDSNALLSLTIIGGPERELRKISSIVRDYFEKVVPTYVVREELSGIIAGFKVEMANIRENNFALEFELERERAILKRMKDLQPPDPNKIPGGLILQIDKTSQNSRYLPLAYQIQAADMNIIDFEETIRANRQKYDCYHNLMSLTEKLFDEVRTKMSSYYTIDEFHSFLADMTSDYTEKQSTDYLNAYKKRIEDMMSANTPVVEKPGVYPIPKGTVKKSAVSFGAFLVIAMFAAFLLEAVQQRQAPNS